MLRLSWSWRFGAARNRTLFEAVWIETRVRHFGPLTLTITQAWPERDVYP